MIARGRDPRPRPLTIPTAQAYYCPRPKPEHPSPSSRGLTPLPEDRRSRTDLKSEYQRPFLARARTPRHGHRIQELRDRAHAVERLLAALRLFSLVDDHAPDLREAPHAFGRTRSLRRRRPRQATATRRRTPSRETARGVRALKRRKRAARRREASFGSTAFDEACSTATAPTQVIIIINYVVAPTSCSPTPSSRADAVLLPATPWKGSG